MFAVPNTIFYIRLMQTGYVHSVETGAASDGPGVRFALFLTGCPFRCLYCHNPDTWELHAGKCTTTDDVMAEIAKYAGFLRIAGGLTITGGEPLTQPEFVHEIFQRAKEELHLHTAIDTNGFLAHQLPDSWFDVVNLVLLDIKQMNPLKHKVLTGCELQPVLDFAKRLDHLGKKMWIRYVLVPGYTDATEDIQALADFLHTLKNVERIEVLPFHNLAIHKWDALGIPYKLKNLRPPSPASVEKARFLLNIA